MVLQTLGTHKLGGSLAHIPEEIAIPNGRDSNWASWPGYLRAVDEGLQIHLSTNGVIRMAILDLFGQKIQGFYGIRNTSFFMVMSGFLCDIDVQWLNEFLIGGAHTNEKKFLPQIRKQKNPCGSEKIHHKPHSPPTQIQQTLLTKWLSSKNLPLNLLSLFLNLTEHTLLRTTKLISSWE